MWKCALFSYLFQRPTFNHWVSFSCQTVRVTSWNLTRSISVLTSGNRHCKGYNGHIWLRRKKIVTEFTIQSQLNSRHIITIPISKHYILRIISINWSRKCNVWNPISNRKQFSLSTLSYSISLYSERFSCCFQIVQSRAATDQTFFFSIKINN